MPRVPATVLVLWTQLLPQMDRTCWVAREVTGKCLCKTIIALARNLRIVAWVHAPDKRGLPSGKSDNRRAARACVGTSEGTMSPRRTLVSTSLLSQVEIMTYHPEVTRCGIEDTGRIRGVRAHRCTCGGAVSASRPRWRSSRHWR